MSDKAEGRNPFTYQDPLSQGSSRLVAPGLISIPSLDTTLTMHREYASRLGKDDMSAYSNEEDVDVVINWADKHEELSYAVLVAQAISAEIGKGLDMLGISWRTNDLNADSGLTANAERLAELGLDASATELVQGAIELARSFEGLRGKWTFDSEFNTTLNETDEIGPELPDIKGLRDWYDVPTDMAYEGFDFDGTALVEDCTTVLEGIVDLILLHEAS